MSRLSAKSTEVAMEQMYGTVELDATYVPRETEDAAGELVVSVTVPPGCHIQANDPGDRFLIPFVLAFDDDSPVGVFAYPRAEETILSWSPRVLRVYHDTVRIAVPVTARTGTVRGKISYQACTGTMCLWPAEQHFEVSLDGSTDREATAESGGAFSPRASSLSRSR